MHRILSILAVAFLLNTLYMPLIRSIPAQAQTGSTTRIGMNIEQPGGIGWRAGHGRQYYPCETLADLIQYFSEIARLFTQSQR
jgi:hypothetical protein